MSPRTEAQNNSIREKRIRAIMDAALSAYIDFGFNGVDMDQVAERAGLSKGLVYYYYKTKQDLFRALFESMFVRMNDLATALMQRTFDENPLRHLAGYIREILSLAEKDSRVIRFAVRLPFDASAVFGAGEWRKGAEQVRRFNEGIRELLNQIIAGYGLAAIETETAADNIWAVIMTNSVSFSRMISGGDGTGAKAVSRKKEKRLGETVRFCLGGLGIPREDLENALIQSQKKGE